MTDEHGAAIPDDLRDLLAAERDRPDLPEETVDLAWRKLSGSLDPGPGGGESSGDGGPSGVAVDDVRNAGLGSGASSGGFASVFGLKTTLLSLVIGAALGFGAAQTLGSASVVEPGPTAPPSVVEPIDEASGRGTMISVDDLPSSVPPPVAAPRATPRLATPPVIATETVKSTLKEERLLLERARAALLRYDHAEAMTAIAAHRTAFPNGQLRGEREALAEQARALEASAKPAR